MKAVSFFQVTPDVVTFVAQGGNEAAQKRREFRYKVKVTLLILISTAIVSFLVPVIALR
jgi:hypothetical protein